MKKFLVTVTVFAGLLSSSAQSQDVKLRLHYLPEQNWSEGMANHHLPERLEIVNVTTNISGGIDITNIIVNDDLDCGQAIWEKSAKAMQQLEDAMGNKEVGPRANPDLSLLGLLMAGAPPRFPTHLKIREKLTAPVYCEPIKVQVDTNMGSLIYTFED